MRRSGPICVVMFMVRGARQFQVARQPVGWNNLTGGEKLQTGGS